MSGGCECESSQDKFDWKVFWLRIIAVFKMAPRVLYRSIRYFPLIVKLIIRHRSGLKISIVEDGDTEFIMFLYKDGAYMTSDESSSTIKPVAFDDGNTSSQNLFGILKNILLDDDMSLIKDLKTKAMSHKAFLELHFTELL